MKRTITQFLTQWLGSSDRQPLVLRGARQVGKTWLVRHLAEQSGKRLIELNLEKRPEYAALFASNDVQQILLNLSTVAGHTIDAEASLLFLDEIQAAPDLFAKLRWFAEDLPTLPVIAAGSLLEFLLAEHSFSMPVGRISYAYLEPLSFEEFLLASNKEPLYHYLHKYNFEYDISPTIHEQLMTVFREYLLVGGMPAVVASWIKQRSLENVNRIQQNLLSSYRDDFAKYKGGIAMERLDEVMMSVPAMLGQKFVYSRVNRDVQSSSVKQALSLLEKARVCYRVQGCAANGVPLAAELHEKYFKEIFLDVGLCSAALGIGLQQLNSISEIILVNEGGIAEQVAGQLLRTIFPPYIQPALYCWNRDEPGSSAEVDYVIQHGNKVIPVEVKAGSTGSLKSLHLFMQAKKSSIAVRINSDYPSKMQQNYVLLSIPFYLAGQIHRLLDFFEAD